MCPVGARVLKFDGPSARGLWYRRFAAMSIYAACRRQRCLWQRKPYNRACGAWKCTPFGAAHHFPRRGKFSRRSASELISISRHKGAKTSPSGGRCRRQKGCISNARRAVCLFSSGRSPVVWFSLRGCHKLNLTPPPSTHSAPALAGKRWWRQPPKGAPPQAAYNTPL